MVHKFAIFGSGLMASIYAEILRQNPETELVAIVGNTEESTERTAKNFGIQGYPGSRYERMLAEHPEVESVIIATPEWVREAPLEAAVRGRRHIMLEKPLADTWDGALRAYNLLKGSDRRFEICHVLRCSPRFSALRDAIRNGQIGEIRHIFARRNSNNVRVLRVLGKTDLAYWLAPHDIDIMRWVTGSEVEQVYAVSRQKLRSADDYLIANLRFAGGIDAVLEVSWCGPPVSPTTRHAIFEVRGSRGNIELDDGDMNVRVFLPDAKVETPDTYEHYDLHGEKGGYFRSLLDHFVRSLRDPLPGSESLTDALEASRVCAMIRRSIDETRVVHSREFA